MKTIATAVSSEKSAIKNKACYAIEIGDGIRLCDWDVDVVYDSGTYTAGTPLKVPKFTEKGGKLGVGNVDDTFSALIINGMIKNTDVTVYEIYFDSDNAVIGAEILFVGMIDGQVFDDHWATLNIARSLTQARARAPRRRLVPACGFIFKSADCGYTGSSGPCTKDMDSCLNTSRFAGFRFVPAKGKTFTWGNTIYKVE